MTEISVARVGDTAHAVVLDGMAHGTNKEDGKAARKYVIGVFTPGLAVSLGNVPAALDPGGNAHPPRKQSHADHDTTRVASAKYSSLHDGIT